MLLKKGKRFPKSRRQTLGPPRYAAEIGKALRKELGGSHQCVKTIMKWTCASERTIKNWLAGTNGPSGGHFIVMIRHSDEFCRIVLRIAGRDEALASIRLEDLRQRHAAAIAEIDRVHQS
jgi:hypothetical protein